MESIVISQKKQLSMPFIKVTCFRIFFLIFLINGACLFGQNAGRYKNNKNLLLSHKFKFEAGVFRPLKSIKINLNSDLPNDVINFGDSFGFGERQVTPNFKFTWKFSKKWLVTADYFNLKSVGGAELDEDIDWGIFTFREGTYVKAGFEMSIYRVFFGRTLFKAAKYEVGVGLGTHILDTHAFIEGEAYVNDFAAGFKKSGLDLVFPLPNVGFWGIYAPFPRWSLSGNIDWFGIKIGEYEGLLWDINPRVSFGITKNFGLDFTYKFVELSVKDKSTYWHGKVSTIFKGPSFGIHGSF